MRRVIKIQDTMQEKKYVFDEEYEGFGIYEHMTPNGYRVNQDWLVTNDDITIICQSFNNYCKDELKDAIDDYRNSGSFGLKVMNNNGIYIVHPSGKERI